MSYSRFSRGYWVFKPEDLVPDLLVMFPDGIFNRKSDVYTYEAEDGYRLHIWSRWSVERDAGYDTPWELAERLIDLKSKGYSVPSSAIAMLVEEQIELDEEENDVN